MKVDWTKTIEGVPMKIVRDIMRCLRHYNLDPHPTRKEIAEATRDQIVRAGRRWRDGWHGSTRIASWHDVDFILTHCVPMDQVQIVIDGRVWSPAKIRRVGEAMTKALLAEGLLQPHDDGSYKFSDAAIGLVCSHATKRFERTKGKQLLNELKQRARAINQNRDWPVYVSEMRVFGSYLTDSNDLGDIDIAINTGHRKPPPGLDWGDWWESKQPHRDAWPDSEMRKYLKARNPRLAIIDMLWLTKEPLRGKPNKVIFRGAPRGGRRWPKGTSPSEQRYAAENPDEDED